MGLNLEVTLAIIRADENVGWTTFWIVMLSVFLTWSVSAAATPPPPPPLITYQPPRQHLAEARRRKLEKAMMIEHERRRQRLIESLNLADKSKAFFPFLEFPPELQLMILSYASSHVATYKALLLVSRRIQHTTFRACLPLMPVQLVTTKQLESFEKLVSNLPSVGKLVHWLWVSPLRKEDRRLACTILKACPNVRHLACEARILGSVVAKHKTGNGYSRLLSANGSFRHKMCRDLTVLVTRPNWEHAFLATRNGRMFLERLERLRVMSDDMVPRCASTFIPEDASDETSATTVIAEPPTGPFRFEHLTHLSYGDRSCLINDANGAAQPERGLPWPFTRQDLFPALKTVALTQRCDPGKIKAQLEGPGLAVVRIPRDYTEMQTWCDGTRGRGLWDYVDAAKPVKAKKDSKAKSKGMGRS